jgi:Domain of unknown function (DUF5666)
MKGLSVLTALFSMSVLTVLAACGGTGSDSGMGGTGTSVGPITGKSTAKSSVSVNGVEFSTAGTSIRNEGNPSDESGLHVGMIVAVHGSFDESGMTGDAREIDFHDNLEGPIQTIDPGAQTLVVMCQTVQTNAGTHYRSDIDTIKVAGLNDLQTGYVIEVSGFTKDDGTILATYIELKSTSYVQGQMLEVKGVIQGLDPSAQTFMFVSGPNSLAVDYSQVAPENLPTGGLGNGMYVEVKSTSEPVGCVLTASRVERRKSHYSDDMGSRLELEGYITRFASATDFDVNGQPVSTTDSTQYEHGTAADLALDVRLEVEGMPDTDGVLIAREISFKNEDGHGSTDDGSEDGHSSTDHGTDSPD